MDLSNYQSFLDSILIVLVLYKCDLKESESFQSIENCLNATNTNVDIFIYDNSPQKIELTLSHYKSKIHYVWNSSNPGVSKAYNEGFTFGEKAKKKWILLLDQDTKFSSGFLMEYYVSCLNNPDTSLFAPILKLDSGEIYSPCKYKFSKAFILKEVDPGITGMKNLSLLNSGILIKMKTFQEIGGYNERLKLDLSDFEFIDRYRKINNSFFILDIVAIHGFSGFQDELNASLARFSRYCQSSVIMCSIRSSLLDKTMLMTSCLIRAIKLAVNFKHVGFLNTFWKTFVILKKST